jgi:hypothetical protein
MREEQQRRTDTLFGSGQKNANRKGRGPAKDRSMAEIGEMPIRHVVNGKLKTTSFDERSMLRMFVDAAKGDPKAAAEIMALRNLEEEAAIKRGPRVTRSAKEKADYEAASRVLMNTYFANEVRALAKLVGADAVHRVNGKWYLQSGAVASGQENMKQRLRQR